MSTGKRVDAGDLFRRSVAQQRSKWDRGFSVDMKAIPKTLDELVLHVALERPAPSDDPDDCYGEWLQHLAQCEFDEQDRPATCSVQTDSWDGRDRVLALEPMLTFAGLAIVSNATSEASRACRGVMLTIPWKAAEKVLAPGAVLR